MICLKDWQIQGNRVCLTYSDDTSLYISKSDFDRAFGCIISADKNAVIRDFVK